MADAYCVYLLRSEGRPGRTYVGSTNHATRRLRQHNGELCGGAKSPTRGRPWRHAAIVSGFRTHSEALSFEWMWKAMPPRRRHGLPARYDKLRDLLRRDRWTRRAPLAEEVALTVTLHEDVCFAIADLPAHVTVHAAPPAPVNA